MTDISQADVETRTRTWSLTDASGDPLIPTAITFTARKGTTDKVWAVGSGVVDDGDGTGSWTVTAGDLDPGAYKWWALVETASEVIIPTDMTGSLRIIDR